jgi:hypothetical protein
MEHFPFDKEFTHFQPIDALQRTDGDVSVHLLTRHVNYTAPVNDPWFLSTVPDKNDEFNIYYNPFPTGAIACVQQKQICNIAKGKCNVLTGGNPKDNFTSLALNKHQVSVMKRLGALRFFDVVRALGGPSLLATPFASGTISTGLPDNQWISEFATFFLTQTYGTALLSLGFVTGPSNPAVASSWTPASPEDEWMCQSQIAQRSDYASFAVLGLIIIFVVGGTIIFLNLALAPAVALFGRLRGHGISEWQLTSLFELQRIAFEGRNKGTWLPRYNQVPVTAKDDKFTTLSREDLSELQMSPTARSTGLDKPDTYSYMESEVPITYEAGSKTEERSAMLRDH